MEGPQAENGAHLEGIEEDTLFLNNSETNHFTGLLVDGTVFVVRNALLGVPRLEETPQLGIVRELLLRLGIDGDSFFLLIRHEEGAGSASARLTEEGSRSHREGTSVAHKQTEGSGEEGGLHREGGHGGGFEQVSHVSKGL